MKEPYFTPETIQSRADELVKEVEEYRKPHPFQPKPEGSALIILDMQRYFLDPGSHAFVPSAPAIVPGLLKLIELFMKLEQPVILTRHLNTSRNAGSLSRWWADMIREDDPMSELIPELAETDGEVLVKNQYDAFYGTPLEEWLKKREITQVVIGGVMTHLCCETTARSAFVRGFEVFFLVDGTATYNLKFHRATLLNLSHGFAHPVLVEEVINRLEEDDEA